HGRYPLWEPKGKPDHVIGLAAGAREHLVTSVLDANPDHRYIFPEPTIWPFISAIAVSVLFIGSIFTPWAVVWGSIPVAIALTAWFWPSKEETVKDKQLEKAP
ncbi:MAG TPA: hypothetical protein VEA39_05920, partial [Methylophilaceae bacterium]|nr:hypothetical protein [Methylophilaceae bacterium]